MYSLPKKKKKKEEKKERKRKKRERENSFEIEHYSPLTSASQLKKAEEARDAEAADLDALTQEFTVRIGEAEKKMQTVLKVRHRSFVCSLLLASFFFLPYITFF